MMKRQCLKSRITFVAFMLLALLGAGNVGATQSAGGVAKTRLAVVGLDHDHVWSLLKDIAGEPSAELVAIAESDPALVSRWPRMPRMRARWNGWRAKRTSS
jgi:hypothetical protein